MIYGTWVVLGVISSGILVIFGYRALGETDQVGFIDPLAFAIDFGLLIIVALNSSFQSWVTSSGIQTYNGDWYFTVIFWAMAFVDLMLAIATIFVAAHNHSQEKLYPIDEDLEINY